MKRAEDVVVVTNPVGSEAAPGLSSECAGRSLGAGTSFAVVAVVLALLALLPLLLSAAGCQESRFDGRFAAGTNRVPVARGVDPSTRRHAEHIEGAALNRFPSDRGPVPSFPRSTVPAARAPQDGTARAVAALTAPGPAVAAAAAAATAVPAPGGTLVLYDDSGPYAWLGELYAIAAGNLASRFGPWTAEPVSRYLAGELSRYTAAIYIGSTYDQPLPIAFLDDVASGARPVMWLYDNIWQLANRVPDFASRYGFLPWRFDTSPIARVDYKGQTLSRYADNASGILEPSGLDPAVALVLASARRADETTLPWALRAGNLTYVGEIPFAYIASDDRYLVFCDLLFDLLAPTTSERHRALVRIEDVSPDTDAAALDALGKALGAQGIPFSIALIPRYTDPNGIYADGQPTSLSHSDNPELLQVLRTLAAGGTELVLHGDTHQYAALANPYSGATADDFEFFRAHVDTADNVVYDGPVAEDGAAWALGRVDSGLGDLAALALPGPTIFEYPHYAGSGVDSRALAQRFGKVYHRGLYFGGSLSGAPDDLAHAIGQFFPYAVTDVFGWRVIPENIGNYEPLPYNNHPARLVPDLVAAARANLVVRDGVASFYFHPYYDPAVLEELVKGIRDVGYSFVPAHDL